VAQGVANLASPLFGGIPATGAIARTATNVKSGGRTPIAGMVHAVVLLLILTLLGRWAALIPMPTLAGILLVVAYNMSEYHLFAKVLRSTRSDALVLVTTFLLTVLVDLTAAIQVGVVLAAFLFMRRMAEVTQVRSVTRMLDEERPESTASFERSIPEGVEVFEISGSFFFGAVHKFKTTLSNIQRTPQVLVLEMSDVLTLDATGLHALEEVYAQSRRSGTALILAGVHAQPLIALERSGLLSEIEAENVVGGIEAALALARQRLVERTDLSHQEN
ncbi:MAG TPA: SulP family inorganic anion transporter, partial [Terriglobales bacterium]|nr:SulP family inorganic anion transporter [Terriglobales bacterium]